MSKAAAEVINLMLEAGIMLVELLISSTILPDSASTAEMLQMPLLRLSWRLIDRAIDWTVSMSNPRTVGPSIVEKRIMMKRRKIKPDTMLHFRRGLVRLVIIRFSVIAFILSLIEMESGERTNGTYNN